MGALPSHVAAARTALQLRQRGENIALIVAVAFGCCVPAARAADGAAALPAADSPVAPATQTASSRSIAAARTR